MLSQQQNNNKNELQLPYQALSPRPHAENPPQTQDPQFQPKKKTQQKGEERKKQGLLSHFRGRKKTGVFWSCKLGDKNKQAHL